MTGSIIAAVITGTCAIIAQILISRRSSIELYAKLDKQSELADARLQGKLDQYQSVTDTKLEELTKEVQKHNRIVERTYQLESKVSVLEEKSKSTNHRIDTLEEAKKCT